MSSLKPLLIGALLTAVLLWFAVPSLAHDHWINHGNYNDPLYGYRCCGEDDCFPLPPDKLKQDKDGNWIIPPHFSFLDQTKVPSELWEKGEIVERDRAIFSEDGFAYICANKLNSTMMQKVQDHPEKGFTNLRCIFPRGPGF